MLMFLFGGLSKAEQRRLQIRTRNATRAHAAAGRATRAREHFPNEQAAMKCLYLVVRSFDPKGTGQELWMNRWKPHRQLVDEDLEHAWISYEGLDPAPAPPGSRHHRLPVRTVRRPVHQSRPR